MFELVVGDAGGIVAWHRVRTYVRRGGSNAGGLVAKVVVLPATDQERSRLASRCAAVALLRDPGTRGLVDRAANSHATWLRGTKHVVR